jgi:hypothetical protein
METPGTGLFNKGKWGTGEGEDFLIIKEKRINVSLIFLDGDAGNRTF